MIEAFIAPMLATEHHCPFDSSDYLFEVKWDGYRCLAHFDHKLTLFSRNGQDWTIEFPSLIPALTKLPGPYLLDGELVILNQEGKPDFSLLQDKANRQAVQYVVFDLLYWQGKSLLEITLKQRRELLAELLTNERTGNIFLSKAIYGKGKAFFEAINAQELEGMIAKEITSFYYPGIRSKAWLKIKERKRLLATVIGYLPNKYSFKSLYLAKAKGNELVYIGKVGTGFSEQEKLILLQMMQTLIQEQCSINNLEISDNNAVWLKPVLVAEIDYLEFTPAGRLRQPSFRKLVTVDD